MAKSVIFVAKIKYIMGAEEAAAPLSAAAATAAADDDDDDDDAGAAPLDCGGSGGGVLFSREAGHVVYTLTIDLTVDQCVEVH